MAEVKKQVRSGALPSVCARRLPTPMTPIFATWDRATLDKFAMDAYLRMQEQQEQLEQARLNLKDAIAAYRTLIKEPRRSGVED